MPLAASPSLSVTLRKPCAASFAEPGQAGRQVAAAGADFEDRVGCLDIQHLQQAPFRLGRHHDLVVAQGDIDVGKGEGAVFFRHEIFTGCRAHHIQHSLVEHVPGTHLLLDHIEAGLFDIYLNHMSL